MVRNCEDFVEKSWERVYTVIKLLVIHMKGRNLDILCRKENGKIRAIRGNPQCKNFFSGPHLTYL